MKTLNNKLIKLTGKKVVALQTKITESLKNRKWLRYSSNISRRILSAMEDDNMSQITLANQIGVSPQYINKVLKGKQNLSLETIAKLSDALEVELISFPEYKYSANRKTIIHFNMLKNETIFSSPVIENSFQSIQNSDLPFYKKKIEYNQPNFLKISNQFIESLPVLYDISETKYQS